MSERFLKSTPQIERGPEQILTKSEVMEGIEMFAKNARIERVSCRMSEFVFA